MPPTLGWGVVCTPVSKLLLWKRHWIRTMSAPISAVQLNHWISISILWPIRRQRWATLWCNLNSLLLGWNAAVHSHGLCVCVCLKQESWFVQHSLLTLDKREALFFSSSLFVCRWCVSGLSSDWLPSRTPHLALWVPPPPWALTRSRLSFTLSCLSLCIFSFLCLCPRPLYVLSIYDAFVPPPPCNYIRHCWMFSD